MYLYSIFFLFLIFGNILETSIGAFSYWDEIVTIVLVIFYLGKIFSKGKIKKVEIKNWFFLCSFILIGLIGNFLSKNFNFNVIFKDIMAASKFYVIMFICEGINVSTEKRKKIIKKTSIISKIIIILTLVFLLLSLYIELPFYTGEVRFMKCFKFIFSHPTFYVSSYLMIVAILIADSISKNRVFIFLGCFLLFLAQRTKAMLIIVFLLLILILGEKNCKKVYDKIIGLKRKKRNPFKLILSIGVLAWVAWIIAKEKILLYFSWGLSAARPALYIIGIQLLLRYFPFGSGFGTFASSLSGKYYSNIYYEYQINNVNGLRKDNYNYIGDVFWPYIYGQFGIAGLIVYIRMIMRCIVYQIKNNYLFDYKISILVIWIYALMASTAEAFFTNSSGVQMALILGIYIGFPKEVNK